MVMPSQVKNFGGKIFLLRINEGTTFGGLNATYEFLHFKNPIAIFLIETPIAEKK